ncbi:hypothetical protein SAMN05421803_103398 [Nocardiopsis flavescens]|uniref:WD40 repeat domain-containing protein n=1 Tax=Nocardiopsis flavescens TaxID=758803 RepID=A0A1M6GFW0_9ACTN|nr:hypothetical protein [Nocardiopsis flavescens]SHJ08807.1 hypothetical protein SAMN05421803_103398 [Nocardiopsis flavescens]
MRRPLVCAVAALTVFLPAPALAEPEVPDGGTGLDYPRGGEGPEGSEIAFTFQDPRISESSGIAPSLRHEGVWWTHNDSGEHPTEVYAVDENGATLATVTLALERRDWEAVSVAPGPDGEPAVHIGDIGDNFGGSWSEVRVYRFPEPEVLADTTLDPAVLTFSYADGGRDAESMMIDPRDGRLYVVSKEFAGGLYAAPAEIDPEGVNTLERVDSAPLFATDAAFGPDGTRYVIRTYWGATVYDSTDGVPGTSLGAFDLPESDQGESVAFTPDGTALMAGTEGLNAPVWRVPLEDRYRTGRAEAEEDAEDAEEAGSPSPSESAGEPPEDGGERGSAVPFIAGGGLVAALLIGGIVLLARRG